MTAINLTITPLRSGLLAGHDSRLEALVRIQAPAVPARTHRRAPLNLALVIDRSGSMRGRPLHEAKRAAAFLVDGLAPADRASLVAYDNRVDVLVPSAPVADRARLHAAIASILTGGTTALYDGWRLGADQALLQHGPDTTSRVLLLSDGCANRGLTDPHVIAERVGSVAESGVTTTTCGLGHNFNEDLMMAMARAGAGNAYYGESAEDLMDPFREELDLLSSLCAQRLRLRLTAPNGIGIRVLNDYAKDADGRWRLPDLAYGGEAWALVELTIPAGLHLPERAGEVEVLRAELDMHGTDDELASAGPACLRLPFLPAAAFAALAENVTVRRRAQEIRAAALQDDARIAARRNDWPRVDALLEEARRESRDNPWLQDSLDALARYARRRRTEAFSKEASYKSSRMRSRLAASNEDHDQYNLDLEADKPSFLRRKLEQGKRMERRPDAGKGDGQ